MISGWGIKNYKNKEQHLEWDISKSVKLKENLVSQINWLKIWLI